MADPLAAAALRYVSYETGGDHEWMLVHGPESGPEVLVLAPLFAEANATRALLADIARRLALSGFRTAIPDLPGTGESLRELETVRWSDWRDAAHDAAAMLGRPHVVALRGGALLDDACGAASHWRLAPGAGAVLLRQLERAQAISDGEAGSAGSDHADVTELAGYRLPRALVDALRAVEPATPDAPMRVLPFDGPGIAPWRRAEPGYGPALAAVLAADIAAWIDSCAH